MNQCMTDNHSLLLAVHASPQVSEIGREALVRRAQEDDISKTGGPLCIEGMNVRLSEG